jgi:hypothetical protein
LSPHNVCCLRWNGLIRTAKRVRGHARLMYMLIFSVPSGLYL